MTEMVTFTPVFILKGVKELERFVFEFCGFIPDLDLSEGFFIIPLEHFLGYTELTINVLKKPEFGNYQKILIYPRRDNYTFEKAGSSKVLIVPYKDTKAYGGQKGEIKLPQEVIEFLKD